jgi:hypothetical protein
MDDVLEKSDGKKMPPPVAIPMTKYQPFAENPEQMATAAVPFEVYQDEITLTNQEPSSNSRPANANQLLFNANETCSTQTFNFFIKSQSVSTPNTKKTQKIFTSECVDEQQMHFKSTAISFSPPITSPPDHANDVYNHDQEYQTPPLITNTQTKQLSTIMETTETNTMSSATSTKSSVDAVSNTREIISLF